MARDCGCDDDYFERSRKRSGGKGGASPDPREALYKTTIMRHYRAMDFRRRLPEPFVEGDMVNRSCGDRIKIQLALADGAIADAAYQGEGCSICIASASMLCGLVKGRGLAPAKELACLVVGMLEESDEAAALEHFRVLSELAGAEADVLSLWSVRAFGARVPCALLSWKSAAPLLEN